MAEAQEWRQYLGRKMSVRFKLHGDPRHTSSEAIGVVLAVGPNEDGVECVQILDRRGEVTLVPTPDVVAFKVFP